MPTPLIIWALVGAILLSYVAFSMLSFDQKNAFGYAFALIPQRFNPDAADHFVNWYEALGPLFGHAFLHV